jgi:hypothetical protein
VPPPLPPTAAAFWLIVVAPPLPLFPPPLPALPLPLLSADAIATFAAAETIVHIPSAAATAAAAAAATATATAAAFFAAVTTSTLISLTTANVSAVQTLPLFPPPPLNCLCLRRLCRHRFRHGSHHCQKFPTCRSVGTSKGW